MLGTADFGAEPSRSPRVWVGGLVEQHMDQDHGEREGDGALGALIEVEQRIEAELASTRDEALRIVEAARREIEARASQREDAVAAERERLREAIERECEASLRDIAEEGERARERYQRIDEPALRQLAEWVATRVAEGRSGA
jgi:hypothetical protein